MAPEQAGSDGGFDGRADVYALAVVGYELVGGRRPFDGVSVTEPRAGGRDDPRPVAGPRGRPAAVDTVLLSGLRTDPDDRPADARQLADALRQAMAERPAPSPVRRWPVGVVVAVALVLFLISALVTSQLR
jgi:serine/threonine protein kinase